MNKKRNKKTQGFLVATLGIAGIALSATTIASRTIENISKNRQIKMINDIASQIESKTFNYTSTSVIPSASNEQKSSPYLGIDLDFITTDQTGVKYSYTNNELNQDGNLEVSIEISKGDISKNVKVLVNVTGIDLSIANSILNALPNVVSYATQLTTISELSAPTTLDENNYFGISVPTNLLGSTITYTHPAIDQDGTLPVTVFVDRNDAQVTKVINVNVSGLLENQINELRLDAQNLLNNNSSIVFPPEFIVIDSELFGQQDAPLENGVLGAKVTLPVGWSAKYSHISLTTNNILKVTVKLYNSAYNSGSLGEKIFFVNILILRLEVYDEIKNFLNNHVEDIIKSIDSYLTNASTTTISQAIQSSPEFANLSPAAIEHMRTKMLDFMLIFRDINGLTVRFNEPIYREISWFFPFPNP